MEKYSGIDSNGCLFFTIIDSNSSSKRCIRRVVNICMLFSGDPFFMKQSHDIPRSSTF